MTIKDFLKDKTWNGSLARVLTALGDEYCMLHYWSIWNKTNAYRKVCDWKLLNSDWTDATLFDQSEETQKAIALLLGWNDVTSKNN